MTGRWEEILPISRVLQRYSEVIEKYGGRKSPPRQGCLEQCLGNAWSAEQYLQDDGVEVGLIFATRLFFYLLSDHCFVDGNKRIAWSCLVLVLLHHGLSVDANDDEAEAFTNAITERKFSQDEIVEWVAARLIEA